ncbi:hypothetical protein BCR34DRAFT_606097 [Clohesyomyces aquaticus]|uniref:Uncharacterized protein n=1 Tax=Clohesyomyces aquaticus TaxID=1231657 RepID=A0A1Y1YTR5_9PLEO|nr:hypothetical protein BCR34DRAFT_606097 [Clohesyomyces aquaticus]
MFLSPWFDRHFIGALTIALNFPYVALPASSPPPTFPQLLSSDPIPFSSGDKGATTLKIELKRKAEGSDGDERSTAKVPKLDPEFQKTQDLIAKHRPTSTSLREIEALQATLAAKTKELKEARGGTREGEVRAQKNQEKSLNHVAIEIVVHRMNNMAYTRKRASSPSPQDKAAKIAKPGSDVPNLADILEKNRVQGMTNIRRELEAEKEDHAKAKAELAQTKRSAANKEEQPAQTEIELTGKVCHLAKIVTGLSDTKRELTNKDEQLAKTEGHLKETENELDAEKTRHSTTRSTSRKRSSL